MTSDSTRIQSRVSEIVASKLLDSATGDVAFKVRNDIDEPNGVVRYLYADKRTLASNSEYFKARKKQVLRFKLM